MQKYLYKLNMLASFSFPDMFWPLFFFWPTVCAFILNFFLHFSKIV